jgi:hypothetical protein
MNLLYYVIHNSNLTNRLDLTVNTQNTDTYPYQIKEIVEIDNSNIYLGYHHLIL